MGQRSRAELLGRPAWGAGCSYLGWLLAAGSSEEVEVKIRGPRPLGVRPPDR